MLIDDMGWYNAPWNGNPEIQERMPHTWKMSREGLILDRHYSYKYCSPARSSLLSGRFPVHVTQNNKVNMITYPGGADLRMKLLPQRLKEVGNYSTACVGKWHVGARSRANLPTHRGFDHHFGYLKGAEDHFTQINNDEKGTEFVDLWSQEAPAYGRNGTTYSTYLYAAEAIRLIEQHATKQESQPLFMYLSWQAMHGPLEAPPEYETPVPNDPRGARAKMNGMAAILDEGVANVTAALKKTGLYENTLIVVSSDNGGWLQVDFGGNNYPLRGGKVTDFEGGVKAAAFVTGGVLETQAPHLLGTRSDLLIHLVDWYATLSGLASSSSTKSDRSTENRDDNSEIPTVDSLDFWNALTSDDATNITAVRTEIPLSACTPEADCDWPGGRGDSALISWPWKIVNGTQAGLGLWQGPQFPNATPKIPMPGPDKGCPQGCLFHLLNDPTEHQDMKYQFPKVFERLWARLLEIGRGVYQTTYDGGANSCLPVETAYKRDKGFLAPRCSAEEEEEVTGTIAR